LDEAQNCTKSQVKLFLTRISENCKIIVCADPTQTDLPNGTPILDIVEKLQNIKGIASIHFKEDAIVRHPLVIQILKHLK